MPVLVESRGSLPFRFVFVIALAFTLTACGGGGSGGGSTSSPTDSGSSSGGDGSSGDSGGGTDTPPANNSPVIDSFEISPSPATADKNLIATVEASDPDGDQLDIIYSWSVNGSVLVGKNANLLEHVYFEKGDTVEARVSASDGTDTTTQNHAVTIANSQPHAAVDTYRTPRSVPRERQVTLFGLAHDVDDDDLTFHWEQVSGTEVALSATEGQSVSFTSPDVLGVLSFSLVVSDGVVDSDPAIFEISVVNRAPSIYGLELTPDPAYTNSTLTATVDVLDDDSDPIQLSYSWAVNDVTVEGETGETLAGDYFKKDDNVAVTAVASDGLAEVDRTVEIQIQDSPPVISVENAPNVLDYGTAAEFSIRVDDPDDEPVSMTFLARPNGMVIDENGNVSWTASGPLFARETNFNWEVQVSSGEHQESVGGVIRVSDPDRMQPTSRSGIEIPGHQEGIVVGDFGDGIGNQLLLTDGRQRLYTASFNGTSYEQNWLYPFSLASESGRVQAIAAADLSGDGVAEFIVGTSEDHSSAATLLLILDGKTRELSHAVEIEGRSISAIRVADTDGDSENELVLLVGIESSYSGGNKVLEVRDGASLQQEWRSSPLVLGESIDVGNTDEDGELEIATSQGYLYSFDGSAYQNEWIYGGGFGDRIALGDVDGDGNDEIAGFVSSDTLRIIDAVGRTVLAQAPVRDTGNIVVANIDSDPEAEIIIGERQWGHVVSYSFSETSGPALVEELRIDAQAHGTTSLAVGNADQDGNMELVWGSGSSSTGKDYLVVASAVPGEGVEWLSDSPGQLLGPFVGGELVSLNGGQRALLFGIPDVDNGSIGSSLLAKMDPLTGRLTYSADLGSNWSRQLVFSATDYDEDGDYEALVASHELYDPKVSLYDLTADSEVWSAPPLESSAVAIANGKLNDDLYRDYILTTSDGQIYAYDIFGSTLLWSHGTGGGVDIAIEEADGSAPPRIIAASSNTITVFSPGETAFTQSGAVSIVDIPEIQGTGTIKDIAVGDIDGDGSREIVAVVRYYSRLGWVVVYNSDLTLRSVFEVDREPSAVAIENYGGPHRNLVIGFGTYSYRNTGDIRFMDPLSGKEVFRSPQLSGGVQKNSLNLIDVDDDTVPEIIFGTNQSMNTTR